VRFGPTPATTEDTSPLEIKTAEFVARSRMYVPELLAEIDRLRAGKMDEAARMVTDVVDLTDERDQTSARAEKAEASCAAMREAARGVVDWIHAFRPDPTLLPFTTPVAALEAALADDAGAALLAERDQLQARLNEILPPDGPPSFGHRIALLQGEKADLQACVAELEAALGQIEWRARPAAVGAQMSGYIGSASLWTEVGDIARAALAATARPSQQQEAADGD
jgi:multidrug resistance efflux pump